MTGPRQPQSSNTYRRSPPDGQDVFSSIGILKCDLLSLSIPDISLFLSYIVAYAIT